MKHFFRVFSFVAFLALAPTAFCQSTRLQNQGNGLTIGTTVNQKIAFHGSEPVVQRSGAAQAALSGTSLKYLAFAGRASAGAITVTGLSVGDTVVGIVNLTDGVSSAASFEGTVSVINQLQQTSGTDLSAKKFSIIVDTGGGKTLINELRAALVELGLIKGSS